ncbi:MAG: Ldh family oxidoreductase, partial [Caldilineaceae bacterium SB0675_bin_29]|nr:Ldh family oxidoreductase [Caldilineaceae bacterium SB0675_bin_29]
MPKFSPHKLTAIAQEIFVAAGLGQDEAGTVAEHLVQANLAGHDSHGVLRIPEYVEWMEAGDVVPGQH